MSRINISSILPLITSRESTDSLQRLLREIVVLQSKLENIDQQSFYFKKGVESNKKRLVSLKKLYDEISDTINTHSFDYFFEELNKHKEVVERVTSQKRISTLVLGSVLSKLEYLKEMLNIKSRFNQLKSIEELLKDEEAMQEIFSAAE